MIITLKTFFHKINIQSVKVIADFVLRINHILVTQKYSGLVWSIN